MKARFLEVAKENKVFPIGAGNWLRLHPEDRIKTPYTRWTFDETTTRMPEFTAPGLGRENNHVTIDAEFGENASGVLYALGGASGGLVLYIDNGTLVYDYNMMIIENYEARSAGKIPAGKHKIEVATIFQSPKPLSPADVTLSVDGKEVGKVTVDALFPPRSLLRKHSTSAPISDRPCRLPMMTGGRSSSMARSIRPRGTEVANQCLHSR